MKKIFQRLFNRKNQEKETIDLSPDSSLPTYTRWVTSQYSHRKFYTNSEILENLKEISMELINENIVIVLSLGNDCIFINQNMIEEQLDILYTKHKDHIIYDELKRSKSDLKLTNDIFKLLLLHPDKLIIYFKIIEEQFKDYIIRIKFHTHQIEN